MAPVASPGSIGAFDQHGQFVEALGGRGRGPGEWQEIAGTLLAGHTNEYVIDRFESDGTALPTIRRTVDWFPTKIADHMREAAARGEPPQATLLRDIQVGDAGIWVLMDRTNPLWRPPADHDPAERLSFSDVEARV